MWLHLWLICPFPVWGSVQIETSSQITSHVQRIVAQDAVDPVGVARGMPSFLHWNKWDTEILPSHLFQESAESKFRPVSIKRVVYRSEKTFVALLGGKFKNFAIKYTLFCVPVKADARNRFRDPIITEVFFLHLLRGKEITNDILYYSRMMPVPDVGGRGKLNPSVCENNQPAMVRYMVTSKTGGNLLAIMRSQTSGVFPFARAVEYGKQLLKLIESLHSYSIIHGDIHLENIVLDGKHMRLIDFKHADRINPNRDFSRGENLPSEMHEADRAVGNILCDPYWSQWEMRLKRPSFRDDVYRALLVMANMIHGDLFTIVIERMCENIENLDAYIQLKESDNFFHLPRVNIQAHGGGYQYRLSVERALSHEGSSRHSTDVIKHFAALLDEVRGLPIGSQPDYNRLQAVLGGVQYLTAYDVDNIDAQPTFEMDD